MILLPHNNQWVQTNRSDILGNLVGSFNLDLTRVLGKTKVGRMIQTTSQATTATLTDYPVGFKVFNAIGTAQIYTVAGSKVHTSATAVPSSSFNADTTTGTPVDCDSGYSDIETFNGGIYVTANSKLYKRTSGNWSSTSFTGAGPWMMTTYAGRLYFTVSGSNLINSTSDGTTIVTPTANYALQLDINFLPTFLRASSNRVWIGTISKTGKGYVYEWDGVSQQVTRGYRLEAQGALACVIKDDVPWILDSNGRLMAYSNGTFIEKARLPLNDQFLLRATNSLNNRFIHPNGMTIVNGRINLLINNILDDANGSIPEFCPSGIWEYDSNIGLYHKYSLSYLPVNETTITDYGQIRLSGVGALSDMKLTNSASNATGNLLAGATVYTNATTTDVGTFTNDTFTTLTGTYHNTLASGYVVSHKISALGSAGPHSTRTFPSVQNMWQNVYVLYRKFLSTSDKILVKYRTQDIDPLEATITWTSTSTFTTTTNILGLEGYEVEVTQGTGGGYTAHISSIDVTAGTYTAHLDDTFTGATGTAKARIQSWKKISTILGTTTLPYDQSTIGELSNWVQLKICMLLARQDEVEKIILINNDYNPAN